jgi:hypothetical protein
MMMEKFVLHVVPEWILERWILVAYLIINWHVKDLADKIQIGPGKDFYKVVTNHLSAYVQEGKMPPDDIAPAILNLADDYMAGRPMNLRAGDYIAIQNHVRRGK